MIKNILVIGGTSGLGLELAEIHSAMGHTVYITGRKDPRKPSLHFINFTIGPDTTKLSDDIHDLVSKIEKVNTLIYAAGFYQEGTIDEIDEEHILEMMNVGLVAPALLIYTLKNNSGKPLKVILITSSSQYTPRRNEPIYTSVKAGLGMLGNSLSLDQEIGKVLVVAPSGMKTPFWDENHDTSDMLNPKWVAEQITALSAGEFKYKYAKILRNPQSVEIIEIRNNI